MSQTLIEWTDATWNPTRGCSRVSEGCRNCYAEKIAGRFSTHALQTGDEDAGVFAGFAIMKNHEAHWTGKVELIESKLLEPLHWRKPRRVFVNSMSDLWHESLPADDQADVYASMSVAYWHDFQVLTKRPEIRADQFRETMFAREVQERAERLISRNEVNKVWHPGIKSWRFQWPLPNVWEGVSIENQPTADARIPQLLRTPAALRFISYEPALEGVDLSPYLGWKSEPTATTLPYPLNSALRLLPDIRGLDWVIIGGESGPGARPFNLEWARTTIRQCKKAGVPVFLKQLGSNPVQTSPGGLQTRYPTKNRKGGDMEEWPIDLRAREFPKTA